jgi:DNA-binding transcriptional LysR family regulator
MSTLHQFRTFATVAKRLNVSRAAAELHVTQAAISNQLKRLETEYESKLWVKNTRGIELTDAGRHFLRHVDVILNSVRRLHEEFRASNPGKRVRCLNIAGNFSASSSVLTKNLALFKKRYPDVQISLRTDDRVAIERMLLNSQVELAVYNHLPRSSQLVSEPYRKERLVVFASPNHPLANGRSVSFDEFARTPLIVRQIKGATTETAKFFRQFAPKVKPNIFLRCETPDAAKMAVSQNLGVGVLFYSNVEPEVRKGNFKIIKLRGINLESWSYIVYHRHRSLSATADKFLALLRESRRRSPFPPSAAKISRGDLAFVDKVKREVGSKARDREVAEVEIP